MSNRYLAPGRSSEATSMVFRLESTQYRLRATQSRLIPSVISKPSPMNTVTLVPLRVAEQIFFSRISDLKFSNHEGHPQWIRMYKKGHLVMKSQPIFPPDIWKVLYQLKPLVIWPVLYQQKLYQYILSSTESQASAIAFSTCASKVCQFSRCRSDQYIRFRFDTQMRTS